MSKPTPVTMLVTYKPKKGKEEELLPLVQKHLPVLQRIGLATAEPAKVWKATNKRTGEVSFVELFQWKDDQAAGIAHQTPEVMAVWEPMGPILEELTLQSLEVVS